MKTTHVKDAEIDLGQWTPDLSFFLKSLPPHSILQTGPSLKNVVILL